MLITFVVIVVVLNLDKLIIQVAQIRNFTVVVLFFAVIKHSDQSNLGEKRIYLACNFQS